MYTTTCPIISFDARIFFPTLHLLPWTVTCNQTIIVVKLSPASAIWLQTNSEKVVFTLREFGNVQSNDQGNFFNFKFRKVFIVLNDFEFYLRKKRIHQNEKRGENHKKLYRWWPSQNWKIYLFKKRKTQFHRRRRVLYKSWSTITNASISCRKQRGRISKGSQFYIWLSVLSLEIIVQINETLMKRGMFLTFWLRTKNDYFNVKSELTEKSVFKREIKTEFIQGKDGLISGRFFKLPFMLTIYWLLTWFVTPFIAEMAIRKAIRKSFLANQFGWFKAENYQVHGVVCETSIIAQPSVQTCEIQRKFWNWFHFKNF